MLSILAATVLQASARLWVSHDFFLSTNGRLWERGKDGIPKKGFTETGLKVLGAASTRDDSLLVLATSPSGGVLSKITLSAVTKAPQIRSGFPTPEITNGEWGVFPYPSGDVVVQEKARPIGHLYSKGTQWSMVECNPDRPNGFVQQGVPYWQTGNFDVWSGRLSGFDAAHPILPPEFHASQTDEPLGDLVQDDRGDSYALVVKGQVTEYALSEHQETRLGPIPDASAVLAHDKDEEPFFAWVGKEGQLKTKRVKGKTGVEKIGGQ